MSTSPQPSSGRRSGAVNRWLNDDGQRHPLENGLAFLTLGLGLLSVLFLVANWWTTAFWFGLVGALVAAYDEFISKTSGERRLILLGFGLCIVGIAVASSNGGAF